jgi:GNAT superfamily N-acetyltransferase
VASLEVTARHDLDPDEIGDRLYEFNKAATGYHDGVDLGFVVEDGPVLIAGASGYTWGGICEIRYLWVHADHRGRGFGAALLRAAVEEARARGCKLMFLSTHSFQATSAAGSSWSPPSRTSRWATPNTGCAERCDARRGGDARLTWRRRCRGARLA